MPQRMGMVRKNAADIKMAVDAVELCFERDYITTFVLGTGDSDFTPLVHKLRELNKRVIGIGVEASTSALLARRVRRVPLLRAARGGRDEEAGQARRPSGALAGRQAAQAAGGAETRRSTPEAVATADDTDLDALVTRTLAGLERSSGGPVLASMLKRAILRKEPTFSEADHGFRTFGELLRTWPSAGWSRCTRGARPAIPRSRSRPSAATRTPPSRSCARRSSGWRRRRRSTSRGSRRRCASSSPTSREKRFGYGTFLQFVRAAQSPWVRRDGARPRRRGLRHPAGSVHPGRPRPARRVTSCADAHRAVHQRRQRRADDDRASCSPTPVPPRHSGSPPAGCRTSRGASTA